MIYNFFHNKLTALAKNSAASTAANKSATRTGTNNYNFENQELTEELHKLVFRKFKKRKVYSSFKLNIWGADATDIQLESKYSKEFDFYYVFLILLINMHVLFL